MGMTEERVNYGVVVWYEFDSSYESVDECKDRRLRQCPLLSQVELDQLRQLATATCDGNLISKSARTVLVGRGLVTRFNGWQVATQEGLAVLHTLGYLAV